jgi:hypothetical protein
MPYCPNLHMCEFKLFNRSLGTIERQQIEASLKTKWGTP